MKANTKARFVRRYHGHAKVGAWSPTYKSWKWMTQRCTLPKNRCWHLYGGRGIKVCERWQGQDGFVNFLVDMGERPDGMTLDRVNSDGNYEPGNCRWADADTQGQNNHHTKLDVEMVNEIRGRAEHGETYASIGRRFHVSKENVSYVVRRRTWQNVP